MQRFVRWSGDTTQKVLNRRRYLRSRRHPRALVLLYHRIAEPEHDPWNLCVKPATFAEQMDLLTSEFRVLPVPELAAGLRRGSLPPRAVGITFDDGYVDNLDCALPELERRQAAASVFVSTGFVGAGKPFWWDELATLVLSHGLERRKLSLSSGRRWITLPTVTSEDRVRALHAVMQNLRRAPAKAVEPNLELIRHWAGVEPLLANGSGRPMDRAELMRLAASPLIDIGAHTRSHPGLILQNNDVARAEIKGSRDDLEGWLGRPPAGFAYPFGDGWAAARRHVRKAGFEYAMAVLARYAVTTRSDPYALPRTLAHEESAAALERRLAAHLDP